MDTRTITFAVAGAMLAIGPIHPANAPVPSPEAMEQVLAQAPLRLRPSLMVSFAEMTCLAENVYFEARGESFEGQTAVAHVTLNRIGGSSFAKTICGVVHQGGERQCQFGWTCGGRPPHEPRDAADWQSAQAAAVRALAGGVDPTRGATYFQKAAATLPHWASGSFGRVVIGQHIFFHLGREAPQHRYQQVALGGD